MLPGNLKAKIQAHQEMQLEVLRLRGRYETAAAHMVLDEMQRFCQRRITILENELHATGDPR